MKKRKCWLNVEEFVCFFNFIWTEFRIDTNRYVIVSLVFVSTKFFFFSPLSISNFPEYYKVALPGDKSHSINALRQTNDKVASRSCRHWLQNIHERFSVYFIGSHRCKTQEKYRAFVKIARNNFIFSVHPSGEHSHKSYFYKSNNLFIKLNRIRQNKTMILDLYEINTCIRWDIEWFSEEWIYRIPRVPTF